MEADMAIERDPGEPEPQTPPPGGPEDGERNPFERPPFERDPEAQRAPGAGESDTGVEEPPMQATERVGNDNIREGRVGGVLGAPSSTSGQGQGG